MAIYTRNRNGELVPVRIPAIKGDKGETGQQGPQGPAGVTPTIKAGTVTTGEAGTSASVTASTSGTTTTFNFTIPKGATGPQGPKGEQGIQGPKGEDGLTTSITVNGNTYNHSNGKITLPNYPTRESLGAASTSVASTSANGLMSSSDKSKLDGIASGANNYTHPSTHPASVIVQDSNNRFVTDAEKSTWNAKASTVVATTGANGLMSSSDKTKLDGIATGANKTVVNNTLSSTSTTEALSAAQGKALNDKIASKSDLKREDLTSKTIDLNTLNLSDGLVQEKYYCEKTTGGATNITNAPVKEPFVLDVISIRWASASDYITQQRFTSATTKATYERFCTNGTWSAWKFNTQFTATPTSGQIVIADGTTGGVKTSGYTIATSVPSGAKFTDTVYTHPTTHAPSIIAQDANNRFVSDTEKSTWNAKASTAVATTSTNGLMSSTDKTKLDGIATGANKTVLNNTVTSTSTTEAATANAVKTAYDKANHSHNYLPLTGGALTGDVSTTGMINVKSTAASADVSLKFIDNIPSIRYGGTGTGATNGFNITGTGNAVKVRIDENGEVYAKGTQKVYHAGNKPTPADIGAAASSHTHNYAGSSSAGGAATSALTCTGNSATATKLATARTISLTGSVTGSGTFDGSGNLSIATTTNHTHSYLPLSGGVLTGPLTLPLRGSTLCGSGITTGNTQIIGTAATTIYFGNPSTGVIIESSKTPTVSVAGTSYTMYHAGNKPTAADIGAAASSHTHNYAGSSSAGGAANSATILATARTINGTSFNGSANITTANWGTARTITIGNSGKSVNGSASVSWSLSEIGAVPTTDYSLTTISKTLTLTTSWQDTGITGTNLASGTYVVQVSGMTSDATSTWSEIWSGTMSWYNGTTNSTDSDEIILHKAGHASNSRTIYLRTIRTSGNTGYLKLQIAASTAFSSSNITFKFRKLI